MIRTTEFASKCPVCGGREFSPLINVRTDAFEFPASVKLAPLAGNNREVIVLARACMSCGYMVMFAALDELRSKLGASKLSAQQVERVLKNMELMDAANDAQVPHVSESQLIGMKGTDTLSAEALVSISQSQPEGPTAETLEKLQQVPGADPWSDDMLDKSNDEALKSMRRETFDEPPEGFKPR